MAKINKQVSLTNLVIENDGKPVTTSLLVAEKFGKRHDDVLRAIRNLESIGDFNLRNFTEINYQDGRGRQQPMYQITKDGFVFLVMGFNGKEASQWKLLYIEAFNKMEEALRNIQAASLNPKDPDWSISRSMTKRNYEKMTLTIQDVIIPSTTLPKDKHSLCYTREADILNKAIFGIKSSEWRKNNPELVKKGKNIRDTVSIEYLAVLTNLEFLNTRLINQGLSLETREEELIKAAKEEFEFMNRKKSKSIDTIKEIVKMEEKAVIPPPSQATLF